MAVASEVSLEGETQVAVGGTAAGEAAAGEAVAVGGTAASEVSSEGTAALAELLRGRDPNEASNADDCLVFFISDSIMVI